MHRLSSFVNTLRNSSSRTRHSRLQLSWYELFFDPAGLSITEKEVAKAAAKAYYGKKTVVLVEFRGWRKSVSAERLARRSTFYLLQHTWLPWRKFVHVRGIEDFHRHFGQAGDPLRGEKPLSWMIVKWWLNVIFSASAPFVLLECCRYLRSREEGDRSSVQKELLSDFYARLPDWYTLTADFLRVLFAFVFLRLFCIRNVYLVDDVMRWYAHEKSIPPQVIQSRLDDIKMLGERQAIVLLSSNEGVTQCFSDKNPTTYATHEPKSAMTSQEMSECLRRQCLDLSASTVDVISSCYKLEHHTRSVRFWRELALLHMKRLPGIAAVQSGGVAPSSSGDRDDGQNANEEPRDSFEEAVLRANSHGFSRAALRSISLNLDLEAHPMGRLIALGHSPEVPIAASLQGTFTPDEIDHIIMVVRRTELPRRVLLTVALLVTGKGPAEQAELQTKLKALQKKLEALKNDILSVEDELAAVENDEGSDSEARQNELHKQRAEQGKAIQRLEFDLRVAQKVLRRRAERASQGASAAASGALTSRAGSCNLHPAKPKHDVVSAVAAGETEDATAMRSDMSELHFFTDVGKMIDIAPENHLDMTISANEIKDLLLGLCYPIYKPINNKK